MKIPMNFQDQLILAPMAGVSDYSFRKLCVLWGADYCVTEMISAKALCFGDRKTAVLARVLKEELPLSVQIFGSEPEIVHKAAKLLPSPLWRLFPVHSGVRNRSLPEFSPLPATPNPPPKPPTLPLPVAHPSEVRCLLRLKSLYVPGTPY